VEILKSNGNKLILCCSAGFDNVPLEECKAAGIRVGRVPSYSPSSIAEYAIASIFALAKNLRRNCDRTRTADFSLVGLQCLLLEDKTVNTFILIVLSSASHDPSYFIARLVSLALAE
jgi:D-lactate dehydrogenase